MAMLHRGEFHSFADCLDALRNIGRAKPSHLLEKVDFFLRNTAICLDHLLDCGHKDFQLGRVHFVKARNGRRDGRGSRAHHTYGMAEAVERGNDRNVVKYRRSVAGQDLAFGVDLDAVQFVHMDVAIAFCQANQNGQRVAQLLFNAAQQYGFAILGHTIAANINAHLVLQELGPRNHFAVSGDEGLDAIRPKGAYRMAFVAVGVQEEKAIFMGCSVNGNAASGEFSRRVLVFNRNEFIMIFNNMLWAIDVACRIFCDAFRDIRCGNIFEAEGNWICCDVNGWRRVSLLRGFKKQGKQSLHNSPLVKKPVPHLRHQPLVESSKTHYKDAA